MRWKRVILPAALLVFLLLAGTIYLLNTPRFISAYPGDAAMGVPAAESLLVEFSRSVDLDSFKSHFVITPSIAGDYSVEDRQIMFTPHRGWPYGETFQVEVSAGVTADNGLPLLSGESWSFTISHPLIAYLWPSDGPADVYALDPQTGDVQRFTQESRGVLDFSISNDGLSIFYTALTEGDDSRIFQIDRHSGTTSVVVECQTSTCRSPSPSPDGRTLAYERHSPSGIRTQVWAIALDNGEPALAGPANHQTSSPSWSSQGMLAFYDHDEKAYTFTDFDQTITIDNDTGEQGAWHPNGQLFIAPEVSLVSVGGEDDNPQGRSIASSQLIAYELFRNTSHNLSQDVLLEDVTPQFSPSGMLIAFARKLLDIEQWTPGRQIWIMSSDGRNAHPLTDSPEYQHTEIHFSPDGTQIVYLRFKQTTLTDPPEIWLIAVDGSENMRLVIGAYQPQWIP